MFTYTRNHSARQLKGLTALGRWLWLAGAVLMLFGAGRAGADDAPPLEYQVKGAFLVKFALFIEWPAAKTNADTNAPLVVGFLGKDPFGDQFDQAVKNERSQGRPIQIRRGRELAELGDCQIIFFCASEAGRFAELLRQLAGRPVLTVADEPGFARRGGMIGFIKEPGKVRFEINPGAAEKAGLKLSSKLVQVGKRVAETKDAQD